MGPREAGTTFVVAVTPPSPEHCSLQNSSVVFYLPECLNGLSDVGFPPFPHGTPHSLL